LWKSSSAEDIAAAEGDGKREEKSKSKSRPPQTKSLPAPRVGLAGALKKHAAWWWPEKGSRVGLDGALTNGVEQALSTPPGSGSSPGEAPWSASGGAEAAAAAAIAVCVVVGWCARRSGARSVGTGTSGVVVRVFNCWAGLRVRPFSFRQS
jgi:hypothetical protein